MNGGRLGARRRAACGRDELRRGTLAARKEGNIILAVITVFNAAVTTSVDGSRSIFDGFTSMPTCQRVATLIIVTGLGFLCQAI